MRLVHFQTDPGARWGVLGDDDSIGVIDGSPFEYPQAEALAGGVPLLSGETLVLADVKLLAPAQPTTVLAVGLNYIDHAEELKMAVPDEPIIFMKPVSAVVGPGDVIRYPEMSCEVDYEAELVVVIGRLCRQVSVADAAGYVLGYTCGNDVTARDLQRKDGQWTRAKSFDTFCPLGPWIETEMDTADLHVEARLNGEVRQSSSTSKMIFGVAELVSFCSRVMSLAPGDVIMTGTPPGVGNMRRGDTIEIEVEGIGTLRNTVAAPRTGGT